MSGSEELTVPVGFVLLPLDGGRQIAMQVSRIESVAQWQRDPKITAVWTASCTGEPFIVTMPFPDVLAEMVRAQERAAHYRGASDIAP